MRVIIIFNLILLSHLVAFSQDTLPYKDNKPPRFSYGLSIELPIVYSKEYDEGLALFGIGLLEKYRLYDYKNKIIVRLRLDEYIGKNMLANIGWTIGISPKIELGLLLKNDKKGQIGFNFSYGEKLFLVTDFKNKFISTFGNTYRIGFVYPFLGAPIDNLDYNSNEIFFQYAQFNNSFKWYSVGFTVNICYKKAKKINQKYGSEDDGFIFK